MKITKVIHNGNTRYRVNESQGPDGKRLRRFFETKEAAEQYGKERKADSKAYGSPIFRLREDCGLQGVFATKQIWQLA